MIVFNQTLSQSNWLFSNDNLILEFNDDTARTPVRATFSFLDVNETLYPRPDGVFWVDLKEHIQTQLSNYDDDVDITNLNSSDINSMVFDWSRVYFGDQITIEITFDNEETEQTTLTPNVLLGFEDILDYKSGKTMESLPSVILNELKPGTSNRYHLKYWEGYPFTFSYSKTLPTPDTDQTITNLTNGVTSDEITLPHDVNKIAISNGDTNVTLETYLPLSLGLNELQFNDFILEIYKIDSQCGVYLKWLNHKGDFSYWLFNSQTQISNSTKSKGSVFNDYSTKQNTVSQYKSLGRTSSIKQSISASNLTDLDINILKSITDSPKVYLFTGERFTKNTFNDWVEVQISAKSTIELDYNDQVPDLNLTLELPKKPLISL